MKPLNPRTIVLDGASYQTSSYFYKGAWRITLGEFTNLDDAVRVRKLLNKEGYNEAFVAVFVNGERSLDMKYFR
jgi:cell division septation protein DedD